MVARQLQSLNWVTQGRADWNIVTAIDGQQNFGQQTMLPSEERYQKAREFTEVVLKLWDSYPSSAIKADKQSGQYAEIDQIQPIGHHGNYFDVQGPLNVPITREEALGLNLSQFVPEQRITPDMLPHPEYQVRNQTHSNLLRRLIERESPTVATLLERPEVIGTVDDAFNAIVERVEAGAADGFIAVPGGSLQSVDLFFDELMPRLSQAGLFRSDYQGQTLRDYLGL